jgi:hypothetical protein
MQNPLDDTAGSARIAARGFLADLREHADHAGSPGWVSIPTLIQRIAEEATRTAGDWPTRSGRHRFLVELAGEARSEWMVQREPAGLRAQFYDALHRRITEMADAERA